MIREVDRFEAVSVEGDFRTTVIVLRTDETGKLDYQTISGANVVRIGEGEYEISTPWGISPKVTCRRQR